MKVPPKQQNFPDTNFLKLCNLVYEQCLYKRMSNRREDFPHSLVSKEPACNAGDLDSNPG